VNVFAIYVANELIQSRLDAAVEWRMAHELPAGPSLRDRIASAGAGLRRLFGAPIDSIGVLPKLEDYPSRG
jgi:hypothetical protein